MEERAVFWIFICSAVQLITAQVSVYPNPLTGIRGQNLTISCIVPVNTANVQLFVGGNGIASHEKYLGLSVVNGTLVQYFYGPLEDSDRELRLRCSNLQDSEDTVDLTLFAPPQYSLRAGQSTAPLEDSDFTYQFNLDNGGVEPSSFTWSRAGTGVLINDTKYTLTADSITVKNVDRDDSVSYTVTATNMAGNHSISFTLDVQFPPEYSIDLSQSTAVVGANAYTYRFMLAANPIPAVFTWMKDGVELSNTSRIGLTVDSITIRDVLRSDAGLYTVTASHAGASATANFTLDVMYPVRVLCGTVCAVVTPVVLVVAVLCCVAVPGTILCYCCLCKKRPGDMRTKPERLSDKEEKEVELT